ncbi:MFS transporter [Paenibacillus aquistagni]|uniref:MFS transporter n=1 Tax=Paenibacillus aquistagni TaxID=1852522 RepID=UPI00145BA0BC|nr:MFS transporter [Paenibacillus aquistagni]NMM52456.1 MFS transporter [Paenibacillus aquistagni]
MHLWHRFQAELQDWHPNIRLFFISNLLYQFGSGMFTVLYNLYIQALGYSQEMNGTIVSIQSLATALMFIPIGLMGDRFSRKHILIAGAMLTGIFFTGRSFVTTEGSLQLFAIGSGLFISFYQVIAIPFLAANTRMDQRLHLFSYHASMVLAAQVLGSIGGGMWADWMQRWGFEKIISLQTSLMIGGLATLVSFIPLLFVKEPSPASASSTAASSSRMKPQQGAQLHDSAALDDQEEKRVKRQDTVLIAKFTFAQILIGLGSGLVVPYLNLYFTDRFAVSLTGVGLLVSLGQIMTIISMLIGPSLAQKVGQVRAVFYFQLLSLPFLLLTGFTTLFVVAAISFLFRQALMNAANPIQSALMVERVSDRRRGIANSCTQTAFMLGWASMGKVQSGLITSYGTYWGYAITFTITGILYVTAATCYYFMFRDVQHKEKANQKSPSIS